MGQIKRKKLGCRWSLLEPQGTRDIWSNVEQMYAWHKALLTQKILNNAARRKIVWSSCKRRLGAETFYWYGWTIFPTPIKTWLVTHNGGNGIFFCDVLRFPDEKVVIIYQTNAWQFGPGDVAFDLARMVFNPDFVSAIKPAIAYRSLKPLQNCCMAK